MCNKTTCLMLMSLLVAIGCKSGSDGRSANWVGQPQQASADSVDQSDQSDTHQPLVADSTDPLPAPPSPPARPDRPDGVLVTAAVLRVNQDVITVDDVLEPIWEDLVKQLAELSPKDYDTYAKRRIRTEVQSQVVQRLAYAEASRRISEEQMTAIDRHIDEIIRDRINAVYAGSQSAFECYLEGFGKTIEDVRERERRAYVGNQYVLSKVTPRIQVGRREMMRYWQQHRSEFETPTQVQVSLIDVPGWAFVPTAAPNVRLAAGRSLWTQADEDTKAKALSAARQHIEKARAAIQSGQDFAEVAKEYSYGIHAARGGAWDFVSLGDMQGRWAPINAVLVELGADQCSQVIEGEDGYFLVHVGDRVEGNTTTFEEAQTKIEAHLAKIQSDRLYGQVMRELQAKAILSGELQQQSFLLAVYDAIPKP